MPGDVHAGFDGDVGVGGGGGEQFGEGAEHEGVARLVRF